MESMLHQLISLVAKTNASQADMQVRMEAMEARMEAMEARMNERFDRMEQRMIGLEQRMDHMIEGHYRDITVLKAESDHVTRKVGIVERDLAVLKGQA
ncbi:MAG: hypothetical protein K0R39_3666 [Symbiobacteriaceae bacterium]|nr:hypothetical protein [Symbiobacteriaceae bacterium]